MRLNKMLSLSNCVCTHCCNIKSVVLITYTGNKESLFRYFSVLQENCAGNPFIIFFTDSVIKGNALFHATAFIHNTTI